MFLLHCHLCFAKETSDRHSFHFIRVVKGLTRWERGVVAFYCINSIRLRTLYCKLRRAVHQFGAMQYMLVWVTESWLGTGQALMMPFTAWAILTAGLVRWCENCGGNNVISESGHSCILLTLFYSWQRDFAKFHKTRRSILWPSPCCKNHNRWTAFRIFANQTNCR